MKRFVFALLYYTGGTRLAVWWNRNRVMILCYHGVTKRSERGPDDPHGLHVRYDRFVAHLDHLQKCYRVISLSDYLGAVREGRNLPRHAVILTFDDGYRNFFTVAASCLAERGLPASAFLITNRMRENGDVELRRDWAAADDVMCMSWAEAKTLEREYGIEFGSHTCSHAELPALSPDEIELELSDSCAAIAARMSKGALPLAYPRGKYSDSIAEQSRMLGYSCALTTDSGANCLGSDPFKLRRTLIGDDDDKPAFAARVSGLTHSLKRLFR